jgi:hypothetical protein
MDLNRDLVPLAEDGEALCDPCFEVANRIHTDAKFHDMKRHSANLWDASPRAKPKRPAAPDEFRLSPTDKHAVSVRTKSDWPPCPVARAVFIVLEHVPKKLTDFFDQNMLEIVVLERILIDRVLPPDRNTL